MHTIISGIKKLSNKNENLLSSFSTFSYQKIKNSELKNILNSCDIFWFRLNHNLRENVLKNVRCKYIVCAATGLDHIDVEYCLNNSIKVISLKGEFDFLKNIRATAEHTVLLALSFLRKTKCISDHINKLKWDRTLFCGSELYKKNIGIYGMGRIGKLVTKYFLAFGAKVYYYDINKNCFAPKQAIKLDTPELLFSTCDIISVHIPLNKKTYNLIDNKLFDLMKKDCLLVNTSRGDIVNEEHLLLKLKNKEILGYTTDVISGEPYIKKNILAKYSKHNDNIFITPHIGGNTKESIEKTESFVLNKLFNVITNE